MRMLKALLLTAVCALTGCKTVYSVRVPLSDSSQPTAVTASNLTIEDRRPEAARKTHFGGGWSCARWYGDDTYVPPKLNYLEQLIAQRLPPDSSARVELHKFDTIEYCEYSAREASAAAVAGANAALGTPMYVPASKLPGEDRVVVQVMGQINGIPFDASREFEYADLRYLNLPAENPAYRERLRKAMGEIADEIVVKLPATQ